MKTVILAGGLGTRISEESHLRPKPMIEVGGRPMLWHIMKLYSHFGLNDFVICAGYRGYMIKEYFANYVLHASDVTVDLRANSITYHKGDAEPWRITIADTGENTMTGGRLKRVAAHLDPDAPFCMTYGDGVADIDIAALIGFHHRMGVEATVTAVHPPGRYGVLEIDGARVSAFNEKPPGDGAMISGGFFVLNRSVIDRISDDATVWERAPLEGLAREGQLAAYRHHGFWQAMDTLRDKQLLENLWSEGNPPWRVWA
ncbi:MAG: glucose-1-phosphate cytidylyltransferase [Alphaproteobacteria bacterium]